MNDFQGMTALVTGASSGLGAEFARALAAQGSSLILTARREAQLVALAAELRTRHGVHVDVVTADLASVGGPRELCERVAALDRPVGILVNNAGFGIHGDFADVPWAREEEMLRLDILAVAELTKHFLPAMIERRRGYVLLLSSIGGYQPSPTYASYSAAKAYVLNLGEALNYELRGTGVRVSVLSPGITATEFLATAGQKASLYQRMMMMQPGPVVASGLRALRRGRPSIVPGLLNALTVWSVRLMPRRLQAAVASALMKVGSAPA